MEFDQVEFFGEEIVAFEVNNNQYDGPTSNN